MSFAKGKVLIGGGSGFVGSNLVRVLKNRGYETQIISRHPTREAISWEDVQAIGIPAGVTAVVNLAGQNIMDVRSKWTENFKKKVWNSRVDTNNILARAIIEGSNNIRAYVAMSGVGIYEPVTTIEHSEQSRVHEFDFFSRMCMEIERASKLPGHLKCRHVVLRSGVVLGRDGGMIKNLYLPFSLGLGGPMAPGYQLLPWIHVSDLVCMIAHCIERDGVTGVINAVAPQIITNAEFAKAFGKALSRPTFFTVPSAVINMMFQEERAKMLTKGPRVVSTRAINTGFKFIYPDINAACEALVNLPQNPIKF